MQTAKLPTYEVELRADMQLYVRDVSSPGQPIWHGPYGCTNDVADAIAMWVNFHMTEQMPAALVRPAPIHTGESWDDAMKKALG